MQKKRQQILTLIAADVAENGKVTAYSIRLYVENRISMASFNEAIRRGMGARRG